MGTHAKQSSDKAVKYTDNGNKLYQFRRVTSDELKQNRIPSYDYVM